MFGTIPSLRPATAFVLPALALLLTAVPGAAQNPNDGFAPAIDGPVYALAIQADGKTVLAGTFSQINGTGRQSLARLTPDGLVDSTFSTANVPNGTVGALVVQGDGKIVIAGNFTQVSGQPRFSMARLLPDGTLDAAFDPNPDNTVLCFALQPDGKVLVGGYFATIAGQPRSRIARLNPEGSLDAGFVPPEIDVAVGTIAVQVDGKILIGGELTQVDGVARNGVVRLHANGSLDASFRADSNGTVNAIAPLLDGRLIVGGTFTQIAGQPRANLARLRPDGSLDSNTFPEADGSVLALLRQPDGRILVGGEFAMVGAAARQRLARLLPDGALDSALVAAANAAVLAFAIGPDARIAVAGAFTQLGGIARTSLAKICADGSVDQTLINLHNTFLAGFSMAVQPDGRIVWFADPNVFDALVWRFQAGGAYDPGFSIALGPGERLRTSVVQFDTGLLLMGGFTQVAGQNRQGFARATPGGSLDTTFNVALAGGAILSAALQPDDRIVVVGSFSEIAGQARSGLARLNADGSLDVSFNTGPNPAVSAVAVQADGRIVYGTSYMTTGGQPAGTVARLAADGSTDPTFQTVEANGGITSLVLHPDGTTLVAGAFTQMAGATRTRLARLRADGSLDGAFSPAVNAPVNGIALQADGRIWLGGEFTTAAGQFNARLTRLRPDGTNDTSPSMPAPNVAVSCVTLQTDGKVLLGGAFSFIGATARKNYARLTNAVAASQDLALSADGQSVTWTLGGSSPLPTWAKFQWSADGVTWSDLGVGTYSDGQWRTSARALPVGVVFVRARGPVQSGVNNTGSMIETVRQLLVSPLPRLTNLSTRGPVQTGDNVLIAGFVLDGTVNKRLLIRAVGPTLADFGVGGVLADPRLTLKRTVGNTTTTVASNDNWSAAGNLSEVLATTTAVGAFDLTAGSADSVLLLDLEPGQYSAVTDGVGDSTGVAIVELYEADSITRATRLGNISTRGLVGAGDSIMIPGFVVSSEGPRTLLVRAVGPTLADFGVPGALADPRLTIVRRESNGSNTTIASNDDWGLAADAANIAAVVTQVGAFELPAGSKDAAVLVTLSPGVYTAQADGVNATTGTALVEVYEVP